MRKIVGLVALGAIAIAAPAIAQNDTGREVIRGVLDALLGPAPQPTQPQPTATPAPTVVRIDDVLAHPRRDGDRARDKYRHPKETLALFQIEPGMTVVDYVPDTGWYARIIAPYLGPSGRYIGMGPDVSSAPDPVRRYWGGQTEKMATNPAGWNLGAAAQISGFNNDAVPEYLVGTVDRVLIFRELHNMLRNGWIHSDMLTFRRLLKPGGMVGIVQHRAHAYDPYSATDGSKGYLREQDVIALFDLYGFDLVARSEVNANPKDPANWENGVWTLPPGYRGTGPNDTAGRAKLDAIGESDRMTMLFRKRP